MSLDFTFIALDSHPPLPGGQATPSPAATQAFHKEVHAALQELYRLRKEGLETQQQQLEALQVQMGSVEDRVQKETSHIASVARAFHDVRGARRSMSTVLPDHTDGTDQSTDGNAGLR